MAKELDHRKLSFNNLDEVVAEAERLASGEHRITGVHAFAKILNHLALSIDVSSGRIQPPPPPFMMKLMRPLMRLMVINSKPMKPGIKLPAKGESFFWPDKELEVEAMLDYLKDAVQHYKASGPQEKHPFFGKLTREQDESLNCRHAALHLGFVHSS